MRQYVIVGSLFLSGCVGLPVSETNQEEQDAVVEVAVAPVKSQQVDGVETVTDDNQEEQTGVASTEQAPAVREQELTVKSVNKEVELHESAPQVSDAQESAPKKLVSQERVTQVSNVPKPKKDMQPTNAVSHWLALAEKAFAKDYLTTPANNNAYAYYGRVLLQEPDNRQALAGLEKIVQRYLNLALSSQRKGKGKQAKLFLQRANKVVPSHKDITVVEAELVRIAANAGKKKAKSATKLVKKRQPAMKFAALQTQQQSIMDAPDGMQRQRILLPPSALSQEAPALAIYLRRLARQIEDVDGRLFIIAPKDKQVRWVYSLLNGTNPDYRIRANMKHKKPAAIEVMYSGDEPILDVFK